MDNIIKVLDFLTTTKTLLFYRFTAVIMALYILNLADKYNDNTLKLIGYITLVADLSLFIINGFIKNLICYDNGNHK